ncbi:hypothetical protein SODALDRAFT_362426 [Sodiomyces alkalinus F11]|uniref:Uncharacterized protein n=1 Tax=Sodiomyces alkalinus (strain CBS 110278 / VKM F-3762 / F11) TaxID=1314773 RepID=A0A3N2PQ28_SODAK|nr:hypothetical protein SODALDRAFT_362426 [Sodiomyces alkalinus F11]ROT36607.1 hypothetical protein SODALDRAFT_362426 [Sodiomyces alkalinus F11]
MSWPKSLLVIGHFGLGPRNSALVSSLFVRTTGLVNAQSIRKYQLRNTMRANVTTTNFCQYDLLHYESGAVRTPALNAELAFGATGPFSSSDQSHKNGERSK